MSLHATLRAGAGLLAVTAALTSGVALTAGASVSNSAMLVAPDTGGFASSSFAATDTGSDTTRVVIDPGELSRGARPDTVYLRRGTIHDGSRTVDVPEAGRVSAFWRTASGHLVQLLLDSGTRSRLVALNPDGDRTRIAEGPISHVEVSANGRRAAWIRHRQRSTSWVAVVASSRSGERVSHRAFRGADVSIEDFAAHRLLISKYTQRTDHPERTMWWNISTDRVRTYAKHSTVAADLSAGQVALTVPGDEPYVPCVEVRNVPRGERPDWLSCQLYPVNWSASGERAIGLDILSDGAATTRYYLLDADSGTRTLTLRGDSLGYGAVWEDARHVLLTAQDHGSGTAAVVRCSLGGNCERASALFEPDSESPNGAVPFRFAAN